MQAGNTCTSIVKNKLTNMPPALPCVCVRVLVFLSQQSKKKGSTAFHRGTAGKGSRRRFQPPLKLTQEEQQSQNAAGASLKPFVVSMTTASSSLAHSNARSLGVGVATVGRKTKRRGPADKRSKAVRSDSAEPTLHAPVQSVASNGRSTGAERAELHLAEVEPAFSHAAGDPLNVSDELTPPGHTLLSYCNDPPASLDSEANRFSLFPNPAGAATCSGEAGCTGLVLEDSLEEELDEGEGDIGDGGSQASPAKRAPQATPLTSHQLLSLHIEKLQDHLPRKEGEEEEEEEGRGEGEGGDITKGPTRKHFHFSRERRRAHRLSLLPAGVGPSRGNRRSKGKEAHTALATRLVGDGGNGGRGGGGRGGGGGGVFDFPVSQGRPANDQGRRSRGRGRGERALVSSDNLSASKEGEKVLRHGTHSGRTSSQQVNYIIHTHTHTHTHTHITYWSHSLTNTHI